FRTFKKIKIKIIKIIHPVYPISAIFLASLNKSAKEKFKDDFAGVEINSFSFSTSTEPTREKNYEAISFSGYVNILLAQDVLNKNDMRSVKEKIAEVIQDAIVEHGFKKGPIALH